MNDDGMIRDLLFERRFALSILDGSKPHTIRKPGKMIRPGMRIELIQDKPRTRLGFAFVSHVNPIRLELDSFQHTPAPAGRDHPLCEFNLAIWTAGRYLDRAQMIRFVWNEGFRSARADRGGRTFVARHGLAESVDLYGFICFMRKWAGLDPGNPFTGDLIAWATPIDF